MNSKTIKTIALASFAAGAMAFFAQASGVAHADTAGVREAANRIESANNLKQINIAAHSYDADGDVDARDFLTWQRSFGSTAAATGDGDVDGHDFLIWQRGDSPAPIASGDLADWQANYGTGGSAAAAGTQTFGRATEMKWDNTAH